MGRILWTGLLLLTLPGCGSGWKGPQVPVEDIPTGRTDVATLEDLPIHLQWKYKHKAFMGTPPAAMGRLLGVSDHKGRVSFLDPNSGRPRAEIKGKGAIVKSPYWDSYRLYLITSHHSRQFQAFNLDGGKPIWYRKFSHTPEPPIEVGEELWLPVGDTVYTLEPTSGEISGAVLRGGDFWLTPVRFANGFAVLGRNGTLHFVNQSGLKQWRYEVDQSCEHLPLVTGLNMWLATAEGTVLCLSPSGDSVWSTQLDSVGLFRPTDGATRLLIGSHSGLVWALDKTTGAILWQTQLSAPLAGSPVAQPNWIAVTTLDGRLWLLDPDNGVEMDFVEFESILSQPPVWAFGRLFIVDSERKLYAYGTSP
jgi:outer membrane protein assembly factor BamB